ncbi:unnamed protein product [Withania somnifera]
MTMINSCENISRQNLGSSTSVYGFGFDFGDYETNYSLMSRLATEGYDDEYYRQRDNSCLIGSELIEVMAEDESRTGSINETGSSSKDNNETNKEEDERGWLQLSIGGHTHMPTNNKREGNSARSSGGGGLVELDLLPTISSEQGKSILASDSPTVQYIHEFRAPPPRRQQLLTMTTTVTSTTPPSLFLQQYPGLAGTSSTTMFPQQHQQEIINWGFRPMPAPIQQNMNLSLMSASSHFGPAQSPVLGGPGPSSIDFRVVPPPRRPHSGLWFSLQSSSNQTKEPFLPQISKSYLRIKDERMTIRLVLKYLVNKLQLENESEIEVTCRGQQLQPFLTLQHVRDHVWNTTNAADDILTLLPSETSNLVMVLHYARRSAAQN